MKTLVVIAVSLTGLAVGLTLLAREEHHWKLSYEKDGIKVFEGHTEAHDTVSMRGETLMPFTRARILEVLSDSDAAAKWMPLILEFRLLYNDPLKERIEASFIDFPWPFSDRVFVSHSLMERHDDKVTIIHIKDAGKVKDLDEGGFVRGKMHFSHFHMTEEKPGQTQMIIELNSDPMGMIPAWMTNWAQANWPYEFFMGLRSVLDNKTYIKKAPSRD